MFRDDFTMISWCFMTFHGLWWYSMMFSWCFMTHDIAWCFMIFHDASRCLLIILIFDGVSSCFMVFFDISWFFMMFHAIFWCFMMFPDVSCSFMMFHDISCYFIFSQFFMMFHEIVVIVHNILIYDILMREKFNTLLIGPSGDWFTFALGHTKKTVAEGPLRGTSHQWKWGLVSDQCVILFDELISKS